MLVKKILNNNLILTVDKEDKEHIVMGKGLRYINTVGEKLKNDNIQKIFVLENEKNARNYMRLLEMTPRHYAETIQDVIQMVNEKLYEKMDEQVFVTLFDHLIYAIERYNKNIVLQNRMLWEVKQFYPKEYELGKEVVTYINKALCIELPEEEAGNIAFHLLNAQTQALNMETTLTSIKMLKDIFSIIQFHFQKKIDIDSINYARFVTHLQFFIQRVLENQMIQSDDSFIYEQIASEYKEQIACATRIQDYVKKMLGKDITKEELLYLTIHIIRIVS